MIKLAHSTILIHAMNDHPDRVRNLRVVLKWLRANFEVQIYVMHNVHGAKTDYAWAMRYGLTDELWAVDEAVSHGTKYRNTLARHAKTPVIFDWIHDVILDDPSVILEAERGLMAGEYDFTFPFADSFHIGWENGQRKDSDIDELERTLSLSHLDFGGYENDKKNVGYIFGALRKTFWAAGGLNEHFIAYSPEDKERFVRWEKLGYRVHRSERGNALHLWHWRPKHDKIENPYEHQNGIEYRRICELPVDKLRKEVTLWPWVKGA